MRRATTIKSKSKFDIMLLGNSAVGKSSLLTRLINDKAPKASPSTATVGAEYKIKTISFPQAYVKLNICDSSGQERYKELLRTYYTSCQGAVVVYDIQDRESFEEAKEWVIELREKVSPDIMIALAGNKVDMNINRKVSLTEAEKYGRDNNLIFMETSSVTGQNVKLTFKALAMALNNQKIQKENDLKNAKSDTEGTEKDKNEKRCCVLCCIRCPCSN